MSNPATQKASELAKQLRGTYGTIYYVRDMDVSLRWFKESLGLKPSFESPHWSEFDCGGHSLCLHILEKGKKSTSSGLLILRVKDIYGVVIDLQSRGVVFEREPHEVHPGAFSADFKDPDGNIVSLYESKA